MSRLRVRNDKGQLTTTEYTIREHPQATDGSTPPVEDEPAQENPIWENPTQAIPAQEEHHQLNTYLQTIDKPKKDLSSTETSNPYQSYPYASSKNMGYDGIGCDSYEEVKEMVYENIEYEHFKQHGGIGMRERLDEIADIIIETLCSTKDTINIAGDDYPARLVKDKMLKITSSHIEYVFDCLNKNTTCVRNIKRYLLATLFNAPSTIDSYYAALVNHDLYSPNR
jgi:hypothetical protein